MDGSGFVETARILIFNIMFNKYIKAKIFFPEQAKKLGLPVSSFVGGMGETTFIISASGQIGKTEAEKVSVHNTKTGEEHVLFEKGKTFELKDLKGQDEIVDSKIEKINKLRAK